MLDLYPEDRDEYQKLLTWCTDSLLSAMSDRDSFEENWDRYDLHYEAFINREQKSWRSRIYMPEVFQQIETIKPRLINNLPKFMAEPVGPEDVDGARVVTELQQWAARSSKLHLELVKTFHPTLLYGTGILKTFPDTQYAFGSEMVPQFANETQIVRKPLIDPETQRQMVDLDGNPQFDEQEVPVQVLLGMRPEQKRYVSYDGPAAKAVNVRNFWAASDAEDVQSSRYCMHRSYKPVEYVAKLIADGVYRLPEGYTLQNLVSIQNEDPRFTDKNRLSLGTGPDGTSKQVELIEIWINDGPGTPGRVITMANRSVLLRVHQNPFWHGQKPFIRFVDYLIPNRFWGIGEVQHMEGIADAINAITNQRIDAGRLSIDQGFIGDRSKIKNKDDLTVRPGRFVDVDSDGFRLDEVIKPLEVPPPSQYAFQEVETLQRMGERTTSVSSYQQGVDAPAQLETATGASIMHDAGNSRFSLKATLFEMDPYKDLSMHFGMILKQYTSDERVLRLVGEDGTESWQQIGPEALQGNFDFTVESASVQQSETVKRQQAMDIFSQVAQVAQSGMLPPELVIVAFKDLLEAMGAKSVLRALEQIQSQPQLPPGPEQMAPEQMEQPVQ